jgi:2-dehydropantoate 2-reductase
VAAAKVAVLGAGSVGCFIGGCWQAASVPVTFVGRQKLAHDIADYGLTVSDYGGWQAHLTPAEVDFRSVPEALAGAGVILVTVKSADTASAAEQIARHALPGTVVVSFQNGISNVDMLQQTLGSRFEVARGMVPYNVAYLGGGRFHKGVAGHLYAEDRPLLRAIGEQVGEGAGGLRFADNMPALAWGKLLINLNNAVNALSGKTLLEELKQRDYRRVFAASMREGLALLSAAGIRAGGVGPVPTEKLPRLIELPDWLFNRFVLKRWKIDAKSRSSMADDLAAGRRTEIDYLNGELVRLAEQLQREAPVNRAIVDLIRKSEAGAPPLGAKALRRAVLGR